MIDSAPKEHAYTVRCTFGDIPDTPTLTRQSQKNLACRGLASNSVLDTQGQGEQYVL